MYFFEPVVDFKLLSFSNHMDLDSFLFENSKFETAYKRMQTAT